MKKFAYALSLISLNVFAFPFNYHCPTDLSFDVEVKSKMKVMIKSDGEKSNSMTVDAKDLKENPKKKTVKLNGLASILGDGEEGYSVYVTMSKSMLKGENVGYINKTAYGPDGGYSESAKCNLIK